MPAQESQATRFLTLKAVEKRVGIGKTRIYELMEQRRFPLPIKPGGWRNLWLESEVEGWLSKLMDARDNTFVVRR